MNMIERARRIAAIVQADFRIRFRRLSTVVVFLLLSITPYLWIPAPSTGRALIQMNGHRLLYNSAALGLATATLAAMFIQLIGFYVVSNAIRRDVDTRNGFIIASTTMRSSEYIIGKFLGNLVFLATFISGFMLSSMAMLVVRGEAPLEPWIFVKHYLLLVPPAIVFASVLAIVFESIPLLSGRFGDVVYFFFWIFSLALVAILVDKTGGGVAVYFDYSGFAYIINTLKSTFHTSGMSIGSSTFDPAKTVLVFPGLTLGSWGPARFGSMVTPLPLLLVARLFFHRFDPARVRSGGAKGHRNWIGRLNALLKPLARLVVAGPSRGSSLWTSARADATVTMEAAPLALVAVAGFAIASLVTPRESFFTGVLPILFAVLGVVIADIASRDHRAGTLGFIHPSPRLQQSFVAWKLLSSSIVVLAFLFVPVVRTILTRPASLLALLAGAAFVTAMSTLLAISSRNPKTFIVLFLTFWYVVNDTKGASPWLDFAGYFGTATPAVALTYFALAIAAGIASQAVYALRLQHDLA